MAKTAKAAAGRADKDKKARSADGPIARHKRARFDYHILDTWEAGPVLTGTEVEAIVRAERRS